MVKDINSRDFDLSGRKILITGAAQGIGRECALWIASMGAKVVLADIKDCSEVAAIIGENAQARHLDLADFRACEKLISEISDDGDPLYGLVNCAGLLIRKTIEDIDSEMLDLHNSVNQSGTFFLARAAMETMRKNGNGGRIILYTSQGAFTGGLNGSTHYSMNKAAVTALVKSLARMAGPHGITVNAVAPGAADTSMFRGGLTADDIANFTKLIPLGRVADPKELAAPTAFLLTDWAQYITGTTLHVNGGQLMV